MKPPLMPNFSIPYLTIGHIKLSLSKFPKKFTFKTTVLAAVIAFLVFLLLVWMSNLSLFWFLLTQGDPAVAFKTVSLSYKILGTNFDLLRAVLIVLFSVLQGINLALFIKGRKSKETVAGSGITTSIVAVGVGCGACGTTLITPVVTSLGLGSASSVDYIGVGLMFLAILVTLYSIHRLVLND